ncbi:unnamed protein product [Rangifer tarandus platyrhynchus]|uniref:Uncharacterized protein n=2 Tax=Rangifer tarandus platyrhynchus TaxID=3082113 RepID=A0AC59ZQI9_RANTA|nr:unnamed protein product [Rangifer tarandus platyrhynchus]
MQKGYRSPRPARGQFTVRLPQGLVRLPPQCARPSRDPPPRRAWGPNTCQVSSKPAPATGQVLEQGLPPHHCPAPPAHLEPIWALLPASTSPFALGLSTSRLSCNNTEARFQVDAPHVRPLFSLSLC